MSRLSMPFLCRINTAYTPSRVLSAARAPQTWQSAAFQLRAVLTQAKSSFTGLTLYTSYFSAAAQPRSPAHVSIGKTSSNQHIDYQLTNAPILKLVCSCSCRRLEINRKVCCAAPPQQLRLGDFSAAVRRTRCGNSDAIGENEQLQRWLHSISARRCKK
jgi:hypothetical protein